MVCQRLQIPLDVCFGSCIIVFSDIKIKLEREEISVYFLTNPLRDIGRNNIFHLNQSMKTRFPLHTVPLAAKVNMCLYYPSFSNSTFLCLSESYDLLVLQL